MDDLLLIYNAPQLVGLIGELLNDNTAFQSRFGGDIYINNRKIRPYSQFYSLITSKCVPLTTGVMGINMMRWRIRIGCLFASRGKIRGRLRGYTMPFISMIGLRLVLLLMVCIIASADHHDTTPVAQQLDLYTSVMWRGDLADRHGLTPTSDSKWSWIIHSSTNRVRA